MQVLRITFFIIFAILFSCEEQGLIIDCSECLSYQPELVKLTVKLKDINLPVRVNVYEGVLEDSVLYDFVETQGMAYNFMVRLNKKYTITATYNIGEITYTAVDSATPKVKYVKEQCEDPCYFMYDTIVDLRLKYTAKGE